MTEDFLVCAAVIVDFKEFHIISITSCLIISHNSTWSCFLMIFAHKSRVFGHLFQNVESYDSHPAIQFVAQFRCIDLKYRTKTPSSTSWFANIWSTMGVLANDSTKCTWRCIRKNTPTHGHGNFFRLWYEFSRNAFRYYHTLSVLLPETGHPEVDFFLSQSLRGSVVSSL